MKQPATNSSMPTPPNRSHTGMSIWDVSIDLANKVYTLAYVALVVGAILTAVSTMSLFWASGVRDKYADGQIQGAKATAAIATERASEAQAEAAKSTERGNALALAAEQARLEQEHIKERLAWRTLSPEILGKLVDGFSNASGSVALAYTQNDPEALVLAIQISKAFEAVNAKFGGERWKVVADPKTYSDRVLFGISIPGPETDAVRGIRNAFTQAGLPFNTDDVPPSYAVIGSMTTRGSQPNTDAMIMIGSRIPF